MGGGGSWNPVEIIENAVSSTGDILASIDPGPAIGDAGVAIDNAVNDVVPGGWSTVGSVAVAIAAPYALGPLTAAEAAALAAGTSATSGAIQGKPLDQIALNAALAGATSYGLNSLLNSTDGIPNWDADITAGAEGYANAAANAAANAGSTAFDSIDWDADITASSLPDQGGIPNWDADITASNLPDQGGLPSYPGDSQYEVQDLQEQARATDVKPGSPTSWDRGESLIPQELKDAANAINKARQVYGIGRSLLGGTAGTAGGLRYMPSSYGSGITDLSGGTTGGSDLIKNLTPGLTAAKQDYTLSGMPDIQETVTPVHFETGGSTTPEYDPFSTDTTIGKSLLKPALTKAQLNYILTGLPGNLIGKAKGGSIHNPEFFSEGGLGSMQNRYVKGAGDGTSDSIPAMLANGEFVIPADVVSSLGNGSNDSGAKILDEFLSTIRKHKRVADAKKLPPDSKGPLAYLLDAKRKVKA